MRRRTAGTIYRLVTNRRSQVDTGTIAPQLLTDLDALTSGRVGLRQSPTLTATAQTNSRRLNADEVPLALLPVWVTKKIATAKWIQALSPPRC